MRYLTAILLLSIYSIANAGQLDSQGKYKDRFALLYHLDTNPAIDVSSNGLSGTYDTGMYNVSGYFGDGAIGNGTSGSIIINNPNKSLNITTQTIGAWIYWNDPATYGQSIYVTDSSAGGTVCQNLLWKDSQVAAGDMAISYGKSNNQQVIRAWKITLKRLSKHWAFLCFTVQADKFPDVYYNGELDNGATSGTVDNTMKNVAIHATGARIGRTGNHPSGYGLFLIDEFFVINGILSNEEIRELYLQGQGRHRCFGE